MFVLKIYHFTEATDFSSQIMFSFCAIINAELERFKKLITAFRVVKRINSSLHTHLSTREIQHEHHGNLAEARNIEFLAWNSQQ